MGIDTRDDLDAVGVESGGGGPGFNVLRHAREGVEAIRRQASPAVVKPLAEDPDDVDTDGGMKAVVASDLPLPLSSSGLRLAPSTISIPTDGDADGYPAPFHKDHAPILRASFHEVMVEPLLKDTRGAFARKREPLRWKADDKPLAGKPIEEVPNYGADTFIKRLGGVMEFLQTQDVDTFDLQSFALQFADQVGRVV